MSRQYKLVDTVQPGCSHQTSSPTDWTLCILCQRKTSETLQCPIKSTRKDVGAGYKYIAENLRKFHELNAIPPDINVHHLNVSLGLEDTLHEHGASWHKSCRNKVNSAKLLRACKRKSEESQEPSPVKTRRSSSEHLQQDHTKETCIFCDQVAGPSGLHKACTFEVDFKVRKCATELCDTRLMAKLAAGDMVAIDAKYHAKCLAQLYKKTQLSRKDSLESSSERLLHGIAFAELVSYIETYRESMEAKPVFSMGDLKNLYISRLQKLGVNDVQVHTTRLKNRILAAIPDLRAHTEGREVLLAYDQDIGAALKQACNEDFDSEALTLAKASKIIRRDVFKLKQAFNGRFPTDCQETAVPSTLTALVNMILAGPNIKEQSVQDKPTSPANQTISQLIVFNSLKCSKHQVSSSTTHRHSKERETPASIYLALKIHGETRKRGLVDTLHNMGLCISYDRVLGISSDIANKVCAMYDKEEVVCPPKLAKNLFTVAAVDNIDHNPSSTTAKDSFHGTGISLMQHPSVENEGTARAIPVMDENSQKRKRIQALPAAYTNVPPVALTKSDPVVPHLTGPVTPEIPSPAPILAKENDWLEHVRELLKKPELDKDDFLSWASYHASLQQALTDPTTIVALMPLFLECAHSVTMIQHSMNVVKAAVEYLNPGQTPVLAMDQPLFAIAKTIQWNFPATHGEDKYLIMFGGLHIEIAAFKIIGDWLDGSGWTTAICNAGITTSGVADSLLKATHVTRTRHAHQVTAAALFVLQHHAYDRYIMALPAGEEPLAFGAWSDRMSTEQPQFQYWALVLELELLVLQIIESFRKGHFKKYVESLALFIPWVFCLDHINYARWLSVHIRDMCSLSTMHPSVYQEFISGRFVARKTKRPFSAMALDQAHEQVNALVKGDGGAVGLTDNANALQRWMVAGPEISRLIAEFEDSTTSKSDSRKHHEQTSAVQTAFAKEVTALVEVFEDMGNPFKEDSGDLLTIDTNLIMDSDVQKTVGNAYKLGQEQYKLFVKERFEDQTKPIKEPIKKNKLQLFSSKKSPQKQKSRVATMKEDCNLFSRLYIACQSREGNLEDFFKHENQPWPPSLSKAGDMRSGNKADLLSELESLAQPAEARPQVTALILDGAVIVQMLSPGTSQTFDDYVKNVFIPYIQHQLQHVERLDIVWDVYNTDSLKATTREKRGKGVRRRVERSSKVPSNWQTFLRVNENKTELFNLLAEEVTSTEFQGKEVHSTYGSQVLSTPQREDKGQIEPCSHEEADTRLILHLWDAAHEGHVNVMVKTSDTDVVVLILSKLHNIPVGEVWISFGVGKHHRYIASHDIAATLGPAKAPAMAMFHAFTGCDTTSFFAGKGKKTAWDTWAVYEDVTDAFLLLADAPSSIPDNTFDLLEKFVVLMYDRTCGLSKVNEARQHLFARRSRALENIPPTQAALKQHALRAAYQGGHVWGQVLQKKPTLPSPADWGWDRSDGSWIPRWTTISQAQDACYELIHCKCKKACRGLCKCYKASLQCTALCHCEGTCYQE